MYTHTYINEHRHIFTHVSTYASKNTYIHLDVHTHTCICMNIHVYAWKNMHTHKYMHTYTQYRYIFTCIHIGNQANIHSYTHTICEGKQDMKWKALSVPNKGFKTSTLVWFSVYTFYKRWNLQKASKHFNTFHIYLIHSQSLMEIFSQNVKDVFLLRFDYFIPFK